MKTSVRSTLIFLASFFLYSCNQKSTENITKETDKNIFSEIYDGDWLITTNIFDSILTFNRIENKDSLPYGSLFTFYKGNLTHEDLSPPAPCGNGAFFIDSCAYEKTNQNFTLYLKGGYLVESNFIYRAKYLLKDNKKSQFKLIRTEVLINKKTSAY